MNTCFLPFTDLQLYLYQLCSVDRTHSRPWKQDDSLQLDQLKTKQTLGLQLSERSTTPTYCNQQVIFMGMNQKDSEELPK